MQIMTSGQAYAAMFHFLETAYLRTRSDDLGGLLGSMSILPDGSPADPAIIASWQAAVEFAVKGGGPAAQELNKTANGKSV
jgi:hypothetical protein